MAEAEEGDRCEEAGEGATDLERGAVNTRVSFVLGTKSRPFLVSQNV